MRAPGAGSALSIRMFTHDHVTVFTHYRKDWPKPYTRDLAHELVDEMDLLGGPTGD